MATQTVVELETYLEAHPTRHQLPDGDVQIEDGVNPHQPQILQGLEPADGGASAWKLLLGAFSFEAILWGKTVLRLSIFISPNCHIRFRSLFWCLPKLLLSSSPVHRQPVHPVCWKYFDCTYLVSCPLYGTTCKAIS